MGAHSRLPTKLTDKTGGTERSENELSNLSGVLSGVLGPEKGKESRRNNAQSVEKREGKLPRKRNY